MSDSITINSRTLRVFVDDVTMLDVDAFVFYARPELTLGAGFGTAISVRGGPSIQEELNGNGPLSVTEVITTAAGDLKADFIIHAVGPAFMEEDTEGKLRKTVLNVLREADRKGIRRVAFPAMGAGFYCVPLDLCADVMIGTISEYLGSENTGLSEVIISVLDKRELKPFRERLGQPATV